MESDHEDQCQNCPCLRYKGGEFQKIINLKSVGLVILKYVRKYINRQPANSNTYVFYNYGDRDIMPAKFTTEFDQHRISCPRCCNVTDIAKKFLQWIQIMKSKQVIVMCDECCCNKTEMNPCVSCGETAKRFAKIYKINLNHIDEKQKKNLNLWLNTINNYIIANSCQKDIEYLDLNMSQYSRTFKVLGDTAQRLKQRSNNVTSSQSQIRLPVKEDPKNILLKSPLNNIGQTEQKNINQKNTKQTEVQLPETYSSFLGNSSDKQSTLDRKNTTETKIPQKLLQEKPKKLSQRKIKKIEKRQQLFSALASHDSDLSIYSLATLFEERLIEPCVKSSKKLGPHNRSKNFERNKNQRNGKITVDKQNNPKSSQIKQKNKLPAKVLIKVENTQVTHLRGGASLTPAQKEDIPPKDPKLAPKETKTEEENLIPDESIKKPDNEKSKKRKPGVQKQADLLKSVLKVKGDTKTRIRNANIIERLPIVAAHNFHRFDVDGCIICDNIDLNIDLESLIMTKNKQVEEPYICIHGREIRCATKPLLIGDHKEPKPMVFKSLFEFPRVLEEKEEQAPVIKNEYDDPRKGVLRYALSDRFYIENGWTVLPIEKVVRKYMVYRMRPAHPELNWFNCHKHKGVMYYDTGEKLAEFSGKNGRGKWFYKNGRIALDYYDSEDVNAKERIVIYSSGEKEPSGRTYPVTVLGIFDHIGNGIVFDHSGKVRLKYNQSEGIVLDRGIGPETHWQWHSLNDPPVLQRVMTETYQKPTDPGIAGLAQGMDPGDFKESNDDVLEIERDNFIKETERKASLKFRPFEIKMKALKINNRFSLKILEQEKIIIFYNEGSAHLKLNIGMVLDNKEIVDVHTDDINRVTTDVEQVPAKTDSIIKLQDYILRAKRKAHAREQHLLKLRGAGMPRVQTRRSSRSEPSTS